MDDKYDIPWHKSPNLCVVKYFCKNSGSDIIRIIRDMVHTINDANHPHFGNKYHPHSN